MRQTIGLLLLSCGWIAISAAGCASGESKKSTKPSMIPSPTSGPSDASSPSRSSQSRLTMSDPCSSRLHELCGPLLWYFNNNQRLPGSLDELRRMPGFESIGPLVCPESKKPYVYNPKGVRGPNVSLIGVIYDSEPTHNGQRWVIAVQEPSGGHLQADVFRWPESRFPKAQPPTTVPVAAE